MDGGKSRKIKAFVWIMMLTMLLLGSNMISTPVHTAASAATVTADTKSAATRKGWYTTKWGNRYYYLNGKKVTGIRKISGKLYYFSKAGRLQQGKNRWITVKGKKYYLQTTGELYTNKNLKLGNTRYLLTADGTLAAKGFHTIGKYTYYVLNYGVIKTSGWQKVNKKYYYFHGNGTMARGLKKIGSYTYYLSKKGVRQSGWKTIKSNRYYFASNGRMQTGWTKIDSKRYYFSTAGILQTNRWIGNYYVGSDGAWIKGYSESTNTSTGWRWPLASTWKTISSYFGNRNSPGGVGSTNHKGIDIPATKGSPIYAVAAGTVVVKQKTAQSGGFGNWIQINHGAGLISEYAHMTKFASGISVGTKVKKGQIIGYVGSTGNSTGNHLHFGVVLNGTRVDPMKYVKQPS